MTTPSEPQQTLFGHPVGLFTLFFAEMWERFSYYGMRALLIFYMLKGFLGFNDNQAYGVYGAYTALVYATPFIGGMLADRLLGARRAVILGGVLMALGHLLMTFENAWAFFTALAMLIVGNGFFKPNISTIVGSLYPPGSGKKDAGFTLFYMGINLGAAMSPLLCGYIGETYGWHYGFGLATFGMLVGLAVFVAPQGVTQGLILLGAFGSAGALLYFQNNVYQLAVNGLVAVALMIAGVVGFMAVGRGGIPADAGLPPDPEAAAKGQWAVYVGVFVSIPILAFLVQRNSLAGMMLLVFGGLAFMWLGYQAIRRDRVERERLFVVLILMFFSMMFWAFFEQAGSSVNNFTDRNVDRVLEDPSQTITADKVGQVLTLTINQEQLGFRVDVSEQLPKMVEPELTDLAPKKLLKEGIRQIAGEVPEVEGEDHEAHEKKVKEQALKNLEISKADWESYNTEKRLRAVVQKLSGEPLPDELDQVKALVKTAFSTPQEDLDKLSAEDLVTKLAHKPLGLTKEQLGELPPEQLRETASRLLGYRFEKDAILVFNLNVRDGLRSKKNESMEWKVTEEHVGMKAGGAEIPASLFQSVNPIFIILFAPLFSMLWERLAAMGKEPSTPVKFALGVLQLGMGFGCLWQGAQTADERGMVWLGWLFLAYLLQTTGELCLSPVGLSMVTKLSPGDIVSATMGAWFLATAFSNYLAGFIATFTGVSHGGGGGGSIPIPIETVGVYGGVFGKISMTAIVVALVCFAMSPLLTRWMHTDVAEGSVE